MTEMRYTIERTRNYSSRAVLRNGIVLIRLARGLGVAKEHEHIETLLKRMTKAYAKEAAKMRIDPFRTILSGEETVNTTIATGSVVNFRIRDGKKTKALRVSEGWSVLRSVAIDDRTFHRYLWKLLALSVKKEIDALVRTINVETLNAPISKVSVKLMHSRWGSCSRTGIIALSTPLLFTTPEILRYVIIHELAHVSHPNHSKAFWNEVFQHEPRYKQLVKELRSYALSHR